MTIRPAQLSDLPGILKIYNQAVAATTATYDVQAATLPQRTAWFESHQRENYPIFVAETNQIILGWSSLNQFHQKPGYRFTVENSVYVDPSQQGRGLGRQLLEPLIPAGRERGYQAILALIDAENTVSLHLHKTLGFEKVGHLKRVGHKFNRWLDVIYMELLLQENQV